MQRVAPESIQSTLYRRLPIRVQIVNGHFRVAKVPSATHALRGRSLRAMACGMTTLMFIVAAGFVAVR